MGWGGRDPVAGTVWGRWSGSLGEEAADPRTIRFKSRTVSGRDASSRCKLWFGLVRVCVCPCVWGGGMDEDCAKPPQGKARQVRQAPRQSPAPLQMPPDRRKPPLHSPTSSPDLPRAHVAIHLTICEWHPTRPQPTHAHRPSPCASDPGAIMPCHPLPCCAMRARKHGSTAQPECITLPAPATSPHPLCELTIYPTKSC